MQVADVPFTDLVGSEDLKDEGVNSDGWTFQTATGLPSGQVGATRDTENTSRAQATGTSFMDVTTTERLAVGMMFRHDTTPADSTEGIVWTKRSGNGCRGIYTTLRYLQCFGRPASGGDATATILIDHPLNTWHYAVWVMDRDPGVEQLRVTSQLGEATASTAGDGSFTSAVAFGFAQGAAPGQEVAALCTWSGADVALLTSSLCQDFLDGVGV